MTRVFVIILALLGSQAHALSCVQQSAQSIYTAAAAAKELYVPVVGRFVFDKTTPQSSGDLNTKSGATFQSMFHGMALNRHGFTTDFGSPVTITTTCIAAWCGGISPNQKVLALLEKTGSDYTLTVSACTDKVIYQPSRSVLEDFVTCNKGGPCDHALR